MLKGRHVIEPNDLSVAEIDEICLLAEDIVDRYLQDVCRGKNSRGTFF